MTTPAQIHHAVDAACERAIETGAPVHVAGVGALVPDTYLATALASGALTPAGGFLRRRTDGRGCWLFKEPPN